jgi:transposase
MSDNKQHEDIYRASIEDAIEVTTKQLEVLADPDFKAWKVAFDRAEQRRAEATFRAQNEFKARVQRMSENEIRQYVDEFDKRRLNAKQPVRGTR